MKTLPTCLLLLILAVPAVRAQSSGSSDTTSATPLTTEQKLESIYNYVRISDDLVTSGQPAYDQIADIKEAGFEVVINLATASQSGNALEAFLVAEQGMTYMNIPVSWQAPADRDLDLFFDLMKINEGRKMFVHCAANMRASAFTFLYRTLVLGDDEAAARADMNKVWDPAEVKQWGDLVARATAGAGR